MPELNDLRPPTRAIGDGAEEVTDTQTVAGFFHDLAAGAGERASIELEFAARQHPMLVLRVLTTAISGRAPLRTTMPPAA